MNQMYAVTRIVQIDRMLRRLTDAKTENTIRSLRNPLTGGWLGERGVLFALRRNNEINDMIERLTDERKRLSVSFISFSDP